MAKQITLGVEDNGISFTFDESTHYLYGDGKIVCPKNSLILVTDNSEMFTLKKANGDVFLSARYDVVDGISSKEDLVQWFITNAVGSTGGGGSVDPEQVDALIDEALVDYSLITSATSGTAVNVYTKSATDALLDDKQDTLVYYSEDTENNEGAIGTSVEDDGVTKSSEVRVASNMYGDSEVSISASEYSDLYDRSAVFYGTQDGIEISYNSTDNVEGTSANQYIRLGVDGVTIEANSDDGESVNTTEFSVTPDGVDIDGDAVVTESQLIDYATVASLSGKADVSAVTAVADSLSGKQDTLVSGTNIKTINNTSLLGSGNIDIQGGGGSSISSCTQAQYDAAEQGGTLDSDTMYVISDAPAVNIANYYTKTEVDDLLLNIDIDVDSAITSSGTNAVQGSAIYTALQGKLDTSEAANGLQWDSTSSALPYARLKLKKGGNNGTTITSADLNLGDHLQYGYPTSSAINVVGLVTQSDYDEAQRVTAAALNDLNDRFGGMTLRKLTQVQYDALVTKDDNTLYIITNVVNNNA